MWTQKAYAHKVDHLFRGRTCFGWSGVNKPPSQLNVLTVSRTVCEREREVERRLEPPQFQTLINKPFSHLSNVVCLAGRNQ